MNTQPEHKKSDVALREEAMQAFWVEHDIFTKSLEQPAGSDPVGDFVFYILGHNCSASDNRSG